MTATLLMMGAYQHPAISPTFLVTDGTDSYPDKHLDARPILQTVYMTSWFKSHEMF